MKDFPCFSMSKITIDDIHYLKEKGFALKYIGESHVINDEYEAFVMPNVFASTSLEANVNTNFNMCTLHGETIGDLKFYGQGAGKHPTANAIVQDILDIKADKMDSTVSLSNTLHYNDTMLANTFMIRTNKKVEDERIDMIETYGDNYYIYTKSLTTREFISFVNKICVNDENAMISKIANF